MIQREKTVVEPAPAAPDSPTAPLPAQTVMPRPRRVRSLLRLAGFALLGTAFLLLFYGGIALLAWRQGETERVARLSDQRQVAALRQLDLAREDLAAGNGPLALRRLDYVLAVDPGNPDAPPLRLTAVAGLAPGATTTPTPSPTPTRRPTGTPTPMADEATEKEKADGFKALTNQMKAGRWERAVNDLLAFRDLYPDYRRREVDEMLYEAYINLGLTLTRGVAIERGLAYLDLAGELGDLSEEVQGEVFWAGQYLEGIVYYGINWEAYLSYFRPMCQFAPLYQNSCGRLADGLTAYANQQVANLDWCPAEDLYREALQTGEADATAVREQLATAAEQCLQATPTPEPTPEADFDAGDLETPPIP